MSHKPRLWIAQLLFVLLAIGILALVEYGKHRAEKEAEVRERVRWLNL